MRFRAKVYPTCRLAIIGALLICVILPACSCKERRRNRDRQWAMAYLRTVSEEHLPAALFAAARSERIVSFPSKGKTNYKYAKINSSVSVETIKLLARMGVDLNHIMEGKTALIASIQGGNREIVNLMLKLGADPLIADQIGKTPLDYAQNNKEIKKIIEDALENIYSEYYEISDPHKRTYLMAQGDSLRNLPANDSLLSSQSDLQNDEDKDKNTPGRRSFNLGGADSYTDYDVAPVCNTPLNLKLPQSAKDAGLKGPVRLSVQVLPTGLPGNIVLTKSIQSGPDGMDEAALNAIKKARFTPAQKAGYPVQATLQVSVTFE